MFDLARKICVMSVALSALLATSCIKEQEQSSDDATLVRVGQMAPDFTVEMLDGDTIRLSPRSSCLAIKQSVLTGISASTFCITMSEVRLLLADNLPNHSTQRCTNKWAYYKYPQLAQSLASFKYCGCNTAGGIHRCASVVYAHQVNQYQR